MRPQFGANLKSLVFAPNNATTASLASYYVTDALSRWEPRIDVLAITVTADLSQADLGKLLIGITYRVRATKDERSLVYPFYLIREE